ncbi:MAG: type IIL restriction-modification enzyme MmeI, partial [Ignavibacteriaceae bacterium]
AMWLIDHQMNIKASETFGEYYVRLPLRKTAVIKHANALQTDWQSLIEPLPWEKEEPKFNYIFGNPPFVGHQWRNETQMRDMELVFRNAKRAGRLDYVAAWYIKAAQYMKEYNFMEPATDTSTELPLRRTLVQHNNAQLTKAAFVSTNSISQGEQVSILWSELFNEYHIKIHFAYRTFKWGNEARNNAAVHVVIIGFANFDLNDKSIFEYENVQSEPHEIKVKNINPYLTEGKDIFIQSRGNPIHGFLEMIKGSQPTDGGHLILNKSEYEELISKEPNSKKWIRLYYGAFEYINSIYRYCLWLKDISPSELKSMPLVMNRVEKVREERLKSPTPSVREYSKYPTLFTQDRQPDTEYLVVPEVSSINRKYIPIGFLSPEIICSNKLQIIKSASLLMFGVMQSLMHMIWTRYVCGRMKSDFSYSPQVYNNFPFPENPNPKQIKTVEEAAQHVLDVRAKFPESSLADLYDSNTMPPELVKAHQALDKAVDLCYRPQAFINETKRIEFLFELYDKLTSGMFREEKKKKK